MDDQQPASFYYTAGDEQPASFHYTAGDQQSVTCFDHHVAIFRLCSFLYKDVNAVDRYVQVGSETSICT